MQTEFRGSEESNEVFKKFFAQPDNAKCFECNAEAREFVSVNNGISLCEKDAGIHRNFGDHISQVKSVHSPEWTSAELKLLEHGGNQKLKDFFSSYNFDAKAAPILKYKTLAAFYYRRKLRFEAEGKEHPEMPAEKEKHLEEHENESFFESLTAGWTGLKNAVKSGVTSAVEFIKEKTQGTTAEDVKDAAKDKAAELKDDAKDLASKAADKKDEVAKDLKDTKENVKEKLEEKKTEASEKLEEKAGGLKETIIDAKDKAVDMASKGIEAVKGQVSNTVEFVKEKAGDMKENLIDKKDKAVDLASKGIEAVKGQVSNAVEFVKEKAGDMKETLLEKKEDAAKDIKETKDEVKEKVDEKKTEVSEKVEGKTEELKEKAGGLSETLHDMKDKAVDMASKGFEAVKGQVSNTVEFVKEKAGDMKENLLDKKDQAVDLASKGIEAVKGQVSNAVEFIKEKAHIESAPTEEKEGDEKKGEEGEKEDDKKEHPEKEKDLEVKDVVHKTEEQLKHEKEIAEKKAKEEKELQEIANEAAESIKTQTMPHTTKSKADQIREQAAMIEAARGKTRVSKGKGVKKQVVQKGSADPEYIEKLQHAGEEEEHDEGDEEDVEEEHDEAPKTEKKDVKSDKKEVKESKQKEVKEGKEQKEEEKLEGDKPHAENKTSAKHKNTQKKEVLATLAREASVEVEEHDPSKAFPAKDDETFPPEEEKKGFDEKEKEKPEVEQGQEHHSLRAAIKETALGGYESLKEKAQNTVDWLKDKVAPLQKDAEHHAGEVKEKAGELKEKASETVDSLKEGDAASIGQKIKDKIVGGMEMAKDKAHDAAEWVQSKVGLGEEGVKTTEEAPGSPSKATAEERKEGTFEKAQKINK